MKSWFTKKDRLLAGTIIAGASVMGFSGPAMAQDEAGAADEEIVVTGSRIPQPNLIGTSPVTQVTSEDITTAGVTRIEDLTNQLPQVFATQGSMISNGATGTAQVNLRGLGAVRNLVLINGRRMPYGSPLSAPADLNQIPSAMVDRVEILTGGASAVYGSDAITGVVNFIMRDNFEGFRIDGQYGFYQHSNDSDDGYIREVIADRHTTNPSQYNLPPDDVTDGYGKEITLVFGSSSEDGKGNVTAYVGYSTHDAVLQANRDFSSCAIGNPNIAPVPGVPAGAVHWTCGGSATSFPGYFYFNGGANVDTIDQTTGNFVPFTAANLYNFGPLNYYQRPDERYTLGAFAHYEINEHIEAYAEAMFSDYRSVSQIAPSGDFFNTNTINCGNPLLPPNTVAEGLCTPAQIAANDTVTLYIARRNVEGGGRQDDLNYESYRMVGGIRGALTDNWNYDLYGLYSRVNLSRTYLNDFSIARMGRALNVVDVAGVPTCQSVVDGTDPACVPWDIFTPGGVTPEALGYLQIPLMQRGETIQQIVSGSLTGDWGFGSPFAESNLETSFGFEYRRDELVSRVDTNFQSGDGAGQGGPTNPLVGHTDVFELFGEARLPLIEDAPMAHLLSVDVAYRFSDYNSGTTTDTYKFGGEWAPVEDIRFRGSYQHAVRAPNIIELFGAQGAGLFNLGFDPCDDVNSPVAVPAICIGNPLVNGWEVTAAQSAAGGLNNPAGQYNGVFGGNPFLEPEEADTWSAGFVFQPTFMEGLSVSLDYWNIELTNAIAAPAQAIVANCYYGGNLSACALIQRLPNGRLRNTAQGVTAINTNIGGIDTSGWDLNVNYNVDIGSAGALGFQLITSKVDELITDVGGGAAFPAYDCVGMWSGDGDCGTPTPEWRSRMRVSWETPWDVEIIGTWRYFSEVTRETMVPFPGTPADPNGGCPGNPDCNKIGTDLDAMNFFDLAGNWDLFENTRLRFGVNNILDQDPPISTNTHTGAGFGNGNTFPQVYDTLGRYMFIGATVDF